MNNRALACHLRAHAARLEQEDENLFRIRAYRQAADTIEAYPHSLAEIYQESGRSGLEAIPDVGDHLAYTLEGLLQTGEFRTLRPEGAAREPHRQLTSLPGIGVYLALRLREQLGISTPEELEQAAQAGRLAEVGIGPRRLQTLLAAFEERRRQSATAIEEPSIAELLQLDAAYRRLVQQQQLPRPWQGQREGYRYRIDFCRQPQARKRDWVTIQFQSQQRAGQRIVLTATQGDLAGRRIVRGRESECRDHYHSAAEPALPALTA
jgi:DNA polymerase (family X)